MASGFDKMQRASDDIAAVVEFVAEQLGSGDDPDVDAEIDDACQRASEKLQTVRLDIERLFWDFNGNWKIN